MDKPVYDTYDSADIYSEDYAIFLAIAKERAYQDRKYGPPAARRLSVGDYLTILRRELREADDAFACEQGIDAALREILQIAAVAVAALEQHGIVEREQ